MRGKCSSTFVSTGVFKTPICLKRYRSLPMEFALLHVPVTAALRKDFPFALSLELPVSIKWRYDRYLIKFYTKKVGLIWRHDARAPGTRHFTSQILCRSTGNKSEKDTKRLHGLCFLSSYSIMFIILRDTAVCVDIMQEHDEKKQGTPDEHESNQWTSRVCRLDSFGSYYGSVTRSCNYCS